MYQFRRVGLSASWLSASWTVGEFVCRRLADLCRNRYGDWELFDDEL